jgi:hypothetical protein
LTDKPTIDPKDNIIRIVSSNEDSAGNENTIPQSDYRLNFVNGEFAEAYGFLVFTSQHVAIMRDNGTGAIPILVAPLGTVQYANIVETEDTNDELPF